MYEAQRVGKADHRVNMRISVRETETEVFPKPKPNGSQSLSESSQRGDNGRGAEDRECGVLGYVCEPMS